MKERGWKQGCAIVHTLKYHEISLSDIISMGKQGTFQLYVHNDKIPETISTNGEFSTAMLHCCCERSVHFKTPRCHGFFQSMFQWLQCHMERLKYSQKGETSRCIWKWRDTKNFQKCILSWKKNMELRWNEGIGYLILRHAKYLQWRPGDLRRARNSFLT